MRNGAPEARWDWLRSYRDDLSEGVWRLQYVFDNDYGSPSFGSTFGNSLDQANMSPEEKLAVVSDVDLDDEGFFWETKIEVDRFLLQLADINKDSTLCTWLEQRHNN